MMLNITGEDDDLADFQDNIMNGTSMSEKNLILQEGSKMLMACSAVVILLAMGCTLTWKDIWPQLRRPVAICIGMLCQFVLLPLSMFALAYALQISSPKAIGMLVIATTPGGAFSNMFTYWSDGDVPLSVCMTSVSTLTAMGMMPLNLFIYGRFWSSAGFSIPYSTMALGMLSLIIPVVVGMLIRRFLPKLAPYVTKFGSLMTGPVVFIFVVLQILIYKDLFNVSWQVYFGAAFGPVMGLSFGFIVGAIARLPWAQCRTVALETGCQNVPLAITLILVSFPQDFVNNAIFVPIVYALCSCVFSLAVVGGWLAYKRWVVSKTAHAQPGRSHKVITRSPMSVKNNKTLITGCDYKVDIRKSDF